MPSTARTTPSSVKKCVLRPLISRRRSAMRPPISVPRSRAISPLASPRGAPRLARSQAISPLASPRGAPRLALPSIHDLAESVQSPLDVLGVHVLMGHAADGIGPDRVHFDLAGLGGLDQ